MADFKIPVALNQDHRVVRVDEAQKGVAYFCPECTEIVIFKQFASRSDHFSHKPNQQCNKETILHNAAKRLVQQVLIDWKEGKGQAPILQRECESCNALVVKPLSEKIESAVLERKLSCGHIVDVALMIGEIPAAVEICVTHPVDKDKSEKLSIPYMELEGIEVIKTPLVWRAKSFKLKHPMICEACNLRRSRFIAEATEIARETCVSLPTSYYRYGFSWCYRCKFKVLVFTWPEHELHTTLRPKQQPLPRTLIFNYSKTTKTKYWMNTCPRCGASQGDFFLYHQFEEPFYGFHCGRDTQDDFDSDLLKIANKADNLG